MSQSIFRWAVNTGWKTLVKVMLELIEVQSGAYLGEDDIVRYEDTYGRTGGDVKNK